MRILFLSPACFPATGSEAIVNSKLVMAFQGAGWEVDVISAVNKGFRYPNCEGSFWEAVRRVTTSYQSRSGSGWNIPHLIQHLDAVFLTRHSIQGIAWVGRAIRIGKELIAKKKYDLIMSRSEPSQLAALVLSKYAGIPWIANWNDPFPIVKYPPPYGRGPSSQISWWMRRYFDAVTRNANWHTFASERLRQYMAKYLPNNVIQNSSVIPHVALDSLRRKYAQKGSNKNLILCHVGTLCHTTMVDHTATATVGMPRDPYVFLKGVKMFLDKCTNVPSICIKFIGRQPDNFGSQLRKFGLDHVVRFDRPRAYLDTLQEISFADTGVVIEADCDEGIFLPSKVVDYVQIGIPILAVSPKVGVLNDLISKYGGGVVADCRSMQAVAKSIETIFDFWKRGCLSKELSSSCLFPVFGEERVIRYYRELFTDIIKRGRCK